MVINLIVGLDKFGNFSCIPIDRKELSPIYWLIATNTYTDGRTFNLWVKGEYNHDMQTRIATSFVVWMMEHAADFPATTIHENGDKKS